jgi:hypothetical protein
MVAVNGTHSTTELEGVVSRVNERGLLLDGRPSWLNLSKFAGAVTLPDAGARVRLSLDAAGFIRQIEPLDAPSAVTPSVPAAVTVPADRETRILREAVLNIAVNILARNGPVNVADVLATAEELEAWILR